MNKNVLQKVKYLLYTKGSHQKDDKKFHTLCELSQKIWDPTPLISRQFQPLSENLKIDYNVSLNQGDGHKAVPIV